MDMILRALHEVDGVQATLVMGADAQILAHRAHAVYDLDLLEEVGRAIVSAIDSVQLVHEDWEIVTASFADGKILVRNLGLTKVVPGRPVALAVVADARLNPSFAGVAIRVAASRLKSAFESPGASGPVAAPARKGDSAAFAAVPVPMFTPPPVVVPPPAPLPQPVAPTPSGPVPTAVSSSASVPTDAASAAFLAACTKALAGSVGPMAKVFVREAVRKVCGDRAFAREHAMPLVAELERHIDDLADRAAFRKSMTGV